ncbi:MAG TPA: glutamine synthetase type III, partial [Isosphaeraceae bacterium]|nr:glutamine synthetase type III [Isosphaeraceae bacterium]
TIVAESIDDIATELEKTGKTGKDLNPEIQGLLQKIIAEDKAVIFNGDNYSEAWHQEAEKRGLPNRKSTTDSLPDLVAPKSVELFSKYGVFSEREIHSRYEILLEGYKKTINIEANLTVSMAQRQILPAAMRYQSQIAGSIANLKAAGAGVPKTQTALLGSITETIEELQASIDKLEEVLDEHLDGDSLSHARYSYETVIPAMLAVRSAGDKLETMVADDLWPLPTYQEMLFVK